MVKSNEKLEAEIDYLKADLNYLKADIAELRQEIRKAFKILDKEGFVSKH